MSKNYKNKKRRQKKLLAVLAALLIVLIAGAVIASEMNNRVEYRDKNDPVATITMQNGKKIVVELYPDKAPNTVANFIELANSGYYDGLIFHRVIPNFMIQGGDPDGNGTGGPGYAIKGEFAANGFANDLPHERGVISMARANPYDSAGSQFFIMHKDTASLNGLYAAFGKVVKGMETVDAIAAVQTDPKNDKPLTDQVMKSVRVDTKGVEYTAEKIEK